MTYMTTMTKQKQLCTQLSSNSAAMQERLVQQMMQAFGTFSGVITNAMLSTAQAMVHMTRAILRVSYLTGNVTEATQLVLS